MGEDPDQDLIDEVQHELENQGNSQERHQVNREDNEDSTRGELIRDTIAASMWNDYYVIFCLLMYFKSYFVCICTIKSYVL